MSKLDELVARHCPNGVEFRTVGDSSKSISMPGKVKREAYLDGSTFPVVDQSTELIAGWTDDAGLLTPADEYVVFGDHTRAVKFVDFAFAQGADGIKVLQAQSGLLTRWLYYCISRLDIPARGYNRHWTLLRDMRIPVPPVPVQRELAEILEAMEALKIELEAELDSRSRQFAHYRDALLRFDSPATCRWAAISDLGSIFGGLTGKSKADFGDDGSRFVAYMNVFANPAVDLSRPDFVRIGPNERQRELGYGDVIFTGSSESKAEVAMSSVVTQLPDEPTYLNSFSIGFRPHDPGVLDPDFSKHLFRSAAMRSQLVKTANGVTRFNVSKTRLGQVLVPVPPLEEQQRIAATLDKLYALTNDLTIGLPAEIAARQQQYEYYRDKLLTFPEKAGA